LLQRKRTVEFLTVEYSDETRFTQDDLILTMHQTVTNKSATGGSGAKNGPQTLNYTAQTLDSYRLYGGLGPTVVGGAYELSKNVHVTSVEFDKPFAYSTSTWNEGQPSSCDKNISKFLRTGMRSDSTAVRGTAGKERERWVGLAYELRTVNVVINNLVEPYRYLLKSVDSPPHIRVIIPGELTEVCKLNNLQVICKFNNLPMSKKTVCNQHC